MPDDFYSFFQSATGLSPYEYQCRLAERVCESHLISIPTGLGKTAAVVMAWLWNRIMCKNDTWPRRLVYCLPMRTLVEQTVDEVSKWLRHLTEEFPKNDNLKWMLNHSPIILMGGQENDPAHHEWDLHPERPAILIGTQDMLLSRALNRGYGIARTRWPIHFGLLNNDALWVMDETQLMGVGVATAAQLEAFRNAFKTLSSTLKEHPSATWYLSATTNPDQLQTRDWRNAVRPTSFEFTLSDDEKQQPEVAKRRNAAKQLELHEDWKIEDHAGEIIKRHKLGQRTLIIVNTVKRAVTVYEALKAYGAAPLLLHSRFRSREREAQRNALTADIPSNGQIVVATQVIEAGVDISSAILWTEVAPLAALVQRFGRLNRKGELSDAQCIAVGLGLETGAQRENAEVREKREKGNADKCLPYDLAACRVALDTLRNISSISPADMEQHRAAIASSIPQVPYSLQRHELLDFFDTDANLSLGFTDVSPFVRGLDEDTDVHILWREAINDGNEPFGIPTFQRDELCAVPISQTKDKEAHDILNKGWLYRGKEAGWASVRDTGIFPGMIVVLPTSAGGYSEKLGWTGKATDIPTDIHSPTETSPDEDLLAFISNGWQSISEHTSDVRTEFADILSMLPVATLTADERACIERGIDWHDIGKNILRLRKSSKKTETQSSWKDESEEFFVWQDAVIEALKKAEISETKFIGKQPLAKFSLSDSPLFTGLSGNDLKRKIYELKNAFHPGIAHEVASALAFRQHEQTVASGKSRTLESVLAEYLIMSHHGRIRKVLRDELPRNPTDAKDTESVRGIQNGDKIPAVEITINGQKQILGCAVLSTDCRRMGRDVNGNESYTRGVLRLLEKYGPFRLAFLETIFRIADCRASAKASEPTN